MDYRYGSHTVYKIEYPLVWVTEYRYKVLIGDVGQRVREVVRQTCEAFEIRIIKGAVSYTHLDVYKRQVFPPAVPTLAHRSRTRLSGGFNQRTGTLSGRAAPQPAHPR